ncbi:nucleoside-triphosphate phosphatase [Salvia divinorum]|uniref:Nucleoside-triphosphate phosphatase n=1 Tax=Salvia divinorum TaxID=28513 RepID=A0ABD1IFV3_SALDI
MAAAGKCFLVIGSPGVGKTTLVIRVLDALKQFNPSLKIQGFYTRTDSNHDVNYPVYGSRESHKWPNVGRYKVDVSSFESLALPELEVKEDTDLFVIDEVGKMELFSASFFPAVLRVLESNIPLLATVPVPKSGRDIPGGTSLIQI